MKKTCSIGRFCCHVVVPFLLSAAFIVYWLAACWMHFYNTSYDMYAPVFQEIAETVPELSQDQLAMWMVAHDRQTGEYDLDRFAPGQVTTFDAADLKMDYGVNVQALADWLNERTAGREVILVLAQQSGIIDTRTLWGEFVYRQIGLDSNETVDGQAQVATSSDRAYTGFVRLRASNTTKTLFERVAEPWQHYTQWLITVNHCSVITAAAVALLMMLLTYSVLTAAAACLLSKVFLKWLRKKFAK